MSVRDALMLEARVAFSRKAQPIWFRVLKWAIAIGVCWYLWRDPHFWWWILAALGLAVAVHLVWRTKTNSGHRPGAGGAILMRPVARRDRSERGDLTPARRNLGGLMHDRSRRLLGGDGADGGGDNEPVSPADLHHQADA